MTDQQVLWQQTNAIKRQVRDAIGTELTHEVRSTNTYQCYTGLCGEVQMAYEDGELSERLVGMLAEYAQKVAELRQEDTN